jgi:hypothetical protein
MACCRQVFFAVVPPTDPSWMSRTDGFLHSHRLIAAFFESIGIEKTEQINHHQYHI